MANVQPEDTNAETRRSFKPQDRRFGDYILGAQLGSGGMGVVYEARQISLNRKVAIKFIRDSQVASPTLLRRFTIEAEAAARLHHPNIVAIHEIGEIDGQPYFCMDLVEGESLRARIADREFAVRTQEGTKSNGRGVQVAIARLMAKTARAVHHAHQRGVLHRDLKPANILLDKNHEPILTDFGLAKILQQTTSQSTPQRLTGSGDITGTPSYMSPEQACSEEVGNAADIYGLGAVLYELLTGCPPFAGNSALDILQQVQKQQPKNPRTLNRLIEKDLATICMKCLEKDPRHRFSSADELANDLENWVEHKPIKARPAGISLRIRQWVKRNPAGAALIASLFIGFSAALVLLVVVNRQKEKFEIQQYELFNEKMRQWYRIWNDPSTREITLSSKELAILDNRTPTDYPDAVRLTLGEVILDDAISYAQVHASSFADLEKYLSATLQTPVELNLRLLKDEPPGGDFASRKIDFMIMDAVSYLASKQSNPGVTAIARNNENINGVIMATTNSRLRQLKDLAGRTLMFPESNEPLTIFSKARLVDAGILKQHLALATNLVYRFTNSPHLRLKSRASSREIAAAVLTRQVDAGATFGRRYAQERHNGLTSLDTFSITSTVFVGRAGLAANVVAAFRSALLKVKGSPAHNDDRDDPSDWGGKFPGALPIDDSYFNALREALKKAAIFDGEAQPNILK